MAATLILAYLAGSIPVGYLVPRLAAGIDIRAFGSGNPGFTNVYRAAGVLPGVIVLVLDIGKGVLAVSLARILGGGDGAAVLAGLAAIVGHVTTPFLRFRGGKGVATAAGVFFTLVPLATAIALLVFAVIVAATRYVSVGSMSAAASLPLLVAVLPRLRGEAFRIAPFLLTLAVAVLIVLRHRANLRRLLAGTESRFSFRRNGGS